MKKCKKYRFHEKSQGAIGSILPGYRDANWQKLRDNAARFCKYPKVINLILVRRRNEIQQEKTRREENLPQENHEARNDINNNDTNNNGVVDKQTNKLAEHGKEL